MKITVLGLGDVGSIFAKKIGEQGLEVVGFDSAKPKNPPVKLIDSARDAVADSDIIFSINSATSSINIAQQVATHLKPGAIYCDLNRGTPALKKKLASIITPTAFVDGAFLEQPSHQSGEMSIAISGDGAQKLIKICEGLNLDIRFVSEVAGDAAARELVRSMLAKGMAAIVIDTLWAAKELGLQQWAIDEINLEFDSSSATTVRQYLDGTQQNPKRQSVEMADISETLTDAGYESTMIRGVELTLSRVIHGVRVPFAELG